MKNRIIFFLILPLLIGCEDDYNSDYKQLSTSDKFTLNTDNSNFETFVGKHLIIYYKTIDSSAVPIIEDAFNHDYDRICGIFGNYPSQKITIKVYPTMQLLLDEEHVYGYIAGIVTGEYSMSIVSPLGIDIYDEAMNIQEQLKVVPHEFIHTQIHKINYSTVTWLNEGTAYFIANQGSILKNSSNLNEVINKIWENEVPSMAALEQNYDSFFKVDYSLHFSYLLIEFIVSKYGINSAVELIKEKGDFQKTIGISKEDFYKLWIDYLRRNYKLDLLTLAEPKPFGLPS